MKKFIVSLMMLSLIGFVATSSAEDKNREISDSEGAKPVESSKAPQSAGNVNSLPAQPVGVKPPEVDSNAIEGAQIFEQGGALTPRGSLVVEPSFQYSHSSSNRVALVGYTLIPSLTVGIIDIRNVESNTLVGAMALRYGITGRLEIETKVPYVYRTDSSSSQDAASQDSNSTKVFSADGNGIGDIEFGLRYQLNRATGGAYYIAGVRAKSNTGKDPFEVPTDSKDRPTKLPTGSGFWGIQPGITVIVPSDPAVFFGSLSYMYNVPRTISDVGKIDPGDIIGFNFGMGFALSEKTSLSIGYDHSVVGRVKRNDELLPGTMVIQVGTLLIGYSHKYSDKSSFSISLGAGLTEAAPGVQLALRVPYSF
jgi:hypothetical protein